MRFRPNAPVCCHVNATYLHGERRLHLSLSNARRERWPRTATIRVLGYSKRQGLRASVRPQDLSKCDDHYSKWVTRSNLELDPLFVTPQHHVRSCASRGSVTA